MLTLTFGCSETEESTLGPLDNHALGMVGNSKKPDDAPAAPQMPGAGTPKVVEVGYYSDRKLTNPITEPVEAGKTIFIKVVFSEPMRHVVSDTKEARPVLYHVREGKSLTRFKIVKRGAGGKDFVNGDAKPWHSGTDDYICKYIVPEKEVTIAVGKWSVDLEDNPLAEFYRHPAKLQVKELHPSLREEPITYGYSFFGNSVAFDVLPLSAWVLDFPGPYREHAPPESNPRDFVGRVCMMVSGANYDNWRAAGGDRIAPVSLALVTITRGPRKGEQVITDEGGYFLFPNVEGDKMYLRVQRAYLEPKEVIVYRSHPTELQQLGPNRVFSADHQNREWSGNAPGIILVGIRWPDAVRPVLESELLPHDLLLIIGPFVRTYGYYSFTHQMIGVFNEPEDKVELNHGTLLHELAHARQDAVAIMHHGNATGSWRDTPEGREYKAAWEKDLAEIPRNLWLGHLEDSDHYKENLLENSAQYCFLYWNFNSGMQHEYHLIRDGGIPARTPNRYKWCQKYLKVHNLVPKAF